MFSGSLKSIKNFLTIITAILPNSIMNLLHMNLELIEVSKSIYFCSISNRFYCLNLSLIGLKLWIFRCPGYVAATNCLILLGQGLRKEKFFEYISFEQQWVKGCPWNLLDSLRILWILLESFSLFQNYWESSGIISSSDVSAGWVSEFLRILGAAWSVYNLSHTKTLSHLHSGYKSFCAGCLAGVQTDWCCLATPK